MIKPNKWLSGVNSNIPSITKVESTTIAILIKLILINRVANNLFGALTSFKMLSSISFPEIFRSSISDGVSEKKADSAAETIETIKSRANIDINEIAMPTEKGLTRIARMEV